MNLIYTVISTKDSQYYIEREVNKIMTSKTLSEKEDQENLKKDQQNLRFWKEIRMAEDKRLDDLHNEFVGKLMENGEISIESLSLILEYTNFLKGKN